MVGLHLFSSFPPRSPPTPPPSLSSVLLGHAGRKERLRRRLTDFDFTFYYSCSKEGKRPSPRPKVSRTPASLFHRGLSGAKGSNKVCRPCEASSPVAQPEECQYTDTQRVNVDAASLFGHLCRMVPDCARPLTFPSRCPEEPRAPIVTLEFHFGGTDAQVSSACAGRLEKIGLEVGNEMNLRHRQVRPLC